MSCSTDRAEDAADAEKAAAPLQAELLSGASVDQVIEPCIGLAGLPIELWRLIIAHLGADLARGLSASLGAAPALKALGATCRTFQDLAHPVVYRSLTLTTKHIASSGNFGLPDLPRYIAHAKRLYTTDDRDIFTRPRVYRLSTQYDRDNALIDRRFATLLWRLADQLEEIAILYFPHKSPDAAHALRQCGRLNFLSVSGDLPASLRTEQGEVHSWPRLKHARFFRCALASVGHILAAPRADSALEHLFLDRVSTGGEDDVFPAMTWQTLQTLEIVDMGVLDIRDVLDSLRDYSLAAIPPLAKLAIDCSAVDINSLHHILDSLSATKLKSLAIMSSPDEESPALRGGILLFQHIADALPHLQQLVFMRGNGYEVVPWIASLAGYADALSSLKHLVSFTANNSNGYHSPAGEAEAIVFASRIASLRWVSFRGKVSMSVGITYDIRRDGDAIVAVERA